MKNLDSKTFTLAFLIEKGRKAVEEYKNNQTRKQFSSKVLPKMKSTNKIIIQEIIEKGVQASKKHQERQAFLVYQLSLI